jgi:hypothetical protein
MPVSCQLLTRLKDLMRNSKSENIQKDLAAGAKAAKHIATQAGNAAHHGFLEEALKGLVVGLDNSGRHLIDSFGELLLYDRYAVIRGSKNQEQTYKVYLFENELTFWETVQSRNKMSFGTRKAQDNMQKLQLKGRTSIRIPRATKF